MPTSHEITSFSDAPAPPGETPWVAGYETREGDIEIAEPDPSWPASYERVAEIVRSALGARVLQLEHVGSTSVPGLPAKPIIDVDLIVADPADEAGWLPPLRDVGFIHTVREPWWQEHRCLKLPDPQANLHVWGPSAAEPWKHRIFRDHLRRDEADRLLYAAVKRASAADANSRGETVMQYNARKQAVIREIYTRAFSAAGLPV
ncbi:GrpB family protein [Microbacterium stercoris]|uniref:GrpB family protein n=1 Tax=Microbacterium stercoris TaxID=2820289 RepID=A0A939QUR7_9MICO|nr:GrpB family protein [Microbacterium stercoris]MBO3665051.1 GrpB family protein [Microbacterium stercoris]